MGLACEQKERGLEGIWRRQLFSLQVQFVKTLQIVITLAPIDEVTAR